MIDSVLFISTAREFLDPKSNFGEDVIAERMGLRPCALVVQSSVIGRWRARPSCPVSHDTVTV